VYDELRPHGLEILAVALDRSPDDVRPWVAEAQATFPILVDVEHRVADLYRIVNVPTSVWIDARGRIVRPNDAAFANDAFIDFHGVPSGPQLDALRSWVRDGTVPFAGDDDIRAHQVAPSADEQLARAERTLAWYLHRQGKAAAAEAHFERAGALAPLDFTIRRGSMPIRGQDPMGPEFVPLFEQWQAAGAVYYAPMAPKR
jgi:hypothetical protein